MSDKPMSENIGRYDGGNYLITAAIWRSEIFDGPARDSYEIGIREKRSGEFWLLQGSYDHQSIQEVANAIAHLLAIKTECYTPEWCREHFK